MILLAESAAAVDTAVPEVKVACDSVVSVSCDMSSLLGLSVVMVEGRGSGVFMFCRVPVIGQRTGRRNAKRPYGTLAINTFYRLRILVDITL